MDNRNYQFILHLLDNLRYELSKRLEHDNKFYQDIMYDIDCIERYSKYIILDDYSNLDK